jgi:valyl-tRNA synthetase
MAWAAKEASANSVMALVALPLVWAWESGKVDSSLCGGLSTPPHDPDKTPMIDKTYQPSEVEGRIYKTWDAAGACRAGRPERAGAPPYSIVIPPPNVTGSLHMGHALNNTLQDVLCRFERMRGKDVLWQPGTDHAGIATQMVVERQLAERKEPGRREMGREAFLKRVWEWKAESGGTIVNQLKRLGASCDWSRERFTMGERGASDDQMVRAVMKAFVDLYNTELPDNTRLIYRDKRLVNWDPKLLTAISDLEVVQVEAKGSFSWSRESGVPFDLAALNKTLDRNPNGHLYYINYPLDGTHFDASDPSTFITVATTRPETMLGDTAVAVHPKNEKLNHLIDTKAIVPLVKRPIPIIGDDYADPEKGTGAVKITPAHDFNDFEVGKRSGLSLINIFDSEARVRRDTWDYYDFPRPASVPPKNLASIGDGSPGEIPSELRGIDRFVARKRIVAMLEEQGYLSKVEPHGHVVPHGDRSNSVIEPFLTHQWYVNAKILAEPAIAAVREGKTQFIPKNWETTYFNWMENIQPWCISRQLWWGHQIPVWYGPYTDNDQIAYEMGDGGKNRVFAAVSEADAIEQAQKVYNKTIEVLPSWRDLTRDDVLQKMNRDNEAVFIWRDPDVLDTWFSSALWPFSTLGWPDDTSELKRFYPTSVLVTGFDIIFFWVARMMMMGLHFMPDVPFHDVYIHRLVRDASGAKMSKSKGNVVDPLGVIDDFGADALRFTLTRNVAPGHDIRLGPQDVENNRNFATKLWNAARFAEMNECATTAGFDPKSAKETLNRWIAHETARAAREITTAIEGYKFNEAAAAAYRFVWNIYCDWYLELAKPVLLGPDGPAKSETQAAVAWARDEILKLLHPFMPFITEELWAVTAQPERKALLALSDWPKLDGLTDDKAEAEIGLIIDLVSAIRSIRATYNVAPAAELWMAVVTPLSKYAESPASVQLDSSFISKWGDFISKLARISEIGHVAHLGRQPGQVNLVVRNQQVVLDLANAIDLPTEIARLAKEMTKAEADIARVDAKLGNANFVARAPEEVVEEEKEKREEAVGRKAKIAEALERLKGAT